MNCSLRKRTLIRSVVPLVLTAALLLPATAGAKTLREPTTGLTLKAPKGFKLKYRNGVFSLVAKGRYAQFMTIRSPLSLAGTGEAMLTGFKATKVKGKKVTDTQFKASAKVRGRPVALRLKQVGVNTQVVVFGGSGKGNAAAAMADVLGRPTVHAAALSAGQIAALDRILRTRAGEPVRRANVGIPFKQFQAPVNNGASAEVPDLPGWDFNGTDTGYLYGGHPTDGFFELGGYIFVNYPSSPFPYPQYPTADMPLPDGALQNVWPAWKKLSGNYDVVFQQVAPIAGTENNLGTGYLSQAYEALFTVNGRPLRGVFNIGVSDNAGSWFTWGLYYSCAAEAVDGPAGILQALFHTWGSWNNSAASVARVQTALQTIASTRPIGGGPIDPDVFQNAADNWSEYIRGPK
ncbi:MAG: hypothetical protein HY827_04525 [Actinobacteria bacterium]|nr:hypothetical protein [Actinomycetota bacterium]